MLADFTKNRSLNFDLTCSSMLTDPTIKKVMTTFPHQSDPGQDLRTHKDSTLICQKDFSVFFKLELWPRLARFACHVQSRLSAIIDSIVHLGGVRASAHERLADVQYINFVQHVPEAALLVRNFMKNVSDVPVKIIAWLFRTELSNLYSIGRTLYPRHSSSQTVSH